MMKSVTAVFHHLAPQARILGIDHLQPLVDLSTTNLQKDGIRVQPGEGGVEIIHSDGRLGRIGVTAITLIDRLA